MADLLPDTKKAYYEQEGKQFIHEQAWMIIKDSPKWAALSQTRARGTQDSQSQALPSTPALDTQTDAANASQDDVALTPANGVTSWKRPPGVHTTKRLLKQDDFNAKKIKLLDERSKNYRERTLAMNQTNDIRQEVAQAEVHASNLEIMAKDPDDLPDDISREFLKLQKEEILEDLRERIKRKKKSAQEKEITDSNPSNSNREDSALSSSHLDSEPPSFNAEGESTYERNPSSQADQMDDHEDGSSEDLHLDPALDDFLM
jgi:hypothetical protein